MSRTRRGVRARETHVIMTSFAARSADDRMLSRWSTSPSSTRISHDPHTPCRQEHGTSIPLSWRTARMLRSTGTLNVRPDCAQTTSNAPATASDETDRAANHSNLTDPAGQRRGRVRDRKHQTFRPAAIEKGVAGRPREPGRDVEPLGAFGEKDGNRAAQSHDVGKERRILGPPRAIEQRPGCARGPRRPDHRQDGRDADPTRDEEVVRRGMKRKGVARTADLQPAADR